MFLTNKIRALALCTSLCLIPSFALAADAPAAAPKAAEKKAAPANALAFTMNDIDGKPVDLAAKYKGKVVLMVNVASECGNTKQYKPLEAMHEKYSEKGLSIVGFPANNFGGQEPGTSEQIKTFCTTKYNVKFDMMEKVSVKGKDQCDLYKYLTSGDAGVPAGDVDWNFGKFLVGRDGKVIARYPAKTQPDDPKLVATIEAELAKEAK